MVPQWPNCVQCFIFTVFLVWGLNIFLGGSEGKLILLLNLLGWHWIWCLQFFEKLTFTLSLLFFEQASLPSNSDTNVRSYLSCFILCQQSFPIEKVALKICHIREWNGQRIIKNLGWAYWWDLPSPSKLHLWWWQQVVLSMVPKCPPENNQTW